MTRATTTSAVSMTEVSDGECVRMTVVSDGECVRMTAVRKGIVVTGSVFKMKYFLSKNEILSVFPLVTSVCRRLLSARLQLEGLH